MSTASQIIETRHDRFYWEAREIMERHDLPQEAFDRIYAERKHRGYMEEIAPYTKQIVYIMSIAMPTRFLYDGNTVERLDDGLTDEMRESVVRWRAVIADIAFKYYGARSLPLGSA